MVKIQMSTMIEPRVDLIEAAGLPQVGSLTRRGAQISVDEQTAWLMSILENSSDAVIGKSLDSTITVWNKAAERLFGYTAEEALGQSGDIIIPPERMEEEREILSQIKRGEQIQNLYTVRKRKDGSLVDVSLSMSPITNPAGKIIGAAKIARDITEQKAADEFMRRALREKELMLKEIHHRVKNNLQVISSLLKLQGEYLPDPKARALFKQSDERVRSMALIHERLYRSDKFSDVDLKEYIQELGKSLLYAYSIDQSAVILELDLQSVPLGIDKAIPCGLLINEFISNAFRHAFPNGRRGKLKVSLAEHDCEVTLRIHDDGRGLPDDFDIERPTSLGFEIIRTLTEQLEGTLEVRRNGGTEFVLRFRQEVLGKEPKESSNGNSQYLNL